MPSYAFMCSNGHKFDEFGHMANPPKSAVCETCHKPARRDYQSELKQIGFVDGTELVHLPSSSGAPLADPGHSTKRVVKNKREWQEMCKKNNWTDYSNSSGPPE
jgi:hypothetical protein